MRIIFATGNAGKMREIREIMGYGYGDLLHEGSRYFPGY